MSDNEEALREVQERSYQQRVAEAQRLYGPKFNAAVVCRHLTDDVLVKEFVRCLEFPSLKGRISFEQQTACAKYIVEYAEGEPISSLWDVNSAMWVLDEWEQQQRLLLKDVHGLNIHGGRLADLIKDHPAVTFATSNDLVSEIELALRALEKLYKAFRRAYRVELDGKKNSKQEPEGDEINIVIE